MNLRVDNTWRGVAIQALAAAVFFLVSFLMTTGATHRAVSDSTVTDLGQRVSKLEAAQPDEQRRLERIESRVDEIYRLMLDQQQKPTGE